MAPPGSIAVDFTRTRSTGRDRLPDYAALLAWAERAEVLARASAARLGKVAAAHPRRAERVHAEALGLRDAVYRILSAASDGRPAPDEDLAVLNSALRRGAVHRLLTKGEDGYEWRFERPSEDDLAAPLWAVAHSAAELLTSDWLERVGVCAADTCRWLFIDESRNRSRRWCDMSDCGTREKVRRFRARAKGAEKKS